MFDVAGLKRGPIFREDAKPTFAVLCPCSYSTAPGALQRSHPRRVVCCADDTRGLEARLENPFQLGY
jgi:hypothetical protein